MAFVSYGSLGANSVQTAGSDITLTVPRTVQVGHFIIVWVAWEKDYYSGVGGEGGLVLLARQRGRPGHVIGDAQVAVRAADRIRIVKMDAEGEK